MNLIFLGALHDAPFGQHSLWRTIDRLRSQYQTEPDLVAFEYAESTYNSLRGMRAELKEKVARKFPQLKKDFIDRFASTLAYEPDIGQTLSATTERVWLLNGFRGDININGQDGQQLQVAISRKLVDVLELWLLPRVTHWKRLNEEKLLSAVNSVYMEESMGMAKLQQDGRCASATHPAVVGLQRSIQKGRESYMFGSLKEALGTSIRSNGFGIVVIGASHLLEILSIIGVLKKNVRWIEFGRMSNKKINDINLYCPP